MAYFISELDQFLLEFDQKNPKKSDSQLADIQKHACIFQLRDHVQTVSLKKEMG